MQLQPWRKLKTPFWQEKSKKLVFHFAPENGKTKQWITPSWESSYLWYFLILFKKKKKALAAIYVFKLLSLIPHFSLL